MTSNSSDNDDPAKTPQLDQADSTGATSSLGTLARRIRGRTTDVLAIAIIAIFGLSFGGRIVEWWATDPDSIRPSAMMPPAGTMPWESPDGAVSLEFGDHPFTIERQALSGTGEQALAAMIGTARRVIESNAVLSADRIPAEKRLLARVAKLEPVAEKRGKWRLYGITEPMPMIVGTRVGLPDSDGKAPPATASKGERVVCWGLGFPFSESGWQMFVFHPADASAETSKGLPRIRLPEGARRSLSMRESGGGAIVGFSGQGPGRRWESHFDRWFAKNGWKREREWMRSGSGSTGRFVAADDPTSGRVEIHLGPVADTKWSGLLTVIPAKADVDSKESTEP